MAEGEDKSEGAPGIGDEPHELPVEDSLDLHAFRPRDVPAVVRDYLAAARERGLAEVRVIHGRGTGFQRERVRDVLASHPDVEWFRDAPPGRGHWGATLVRLRRGSDPDRRDAVRRGG